MRTHQYAHKKRASQSFRTPISRPSEVQSSVQPPPIQAKSNEEGLAEHAERLRKFQRLGNSMMQMGPPRLDNNTTSSVQPKPWIQRKLTIGEPGDKYEQEADRVASQVAQHINAPTFKENSIRESIQREKDLEGVMCARGFQAAIQRKQAIEGGEESPDLESAISSARGGGQPLDAGLQQSMGQAMGADFSGVRVHTDAQSDQLNQSIQARAFTTGQDVFFREGTYQPRSKGGQELIAHELTHVVQQSPTIQAKSNGEGLADWERSNMCETMRLDESLPKLGVLQRAKMTKYERFAKFFEGESFNEGRMGIVGRHSYEAENDDTKGKSLYESIAYKVNGNSFNMADTNQNYCQSMLVNAAEHQIDDQNKHRAQDFIHPLESGSMVIDQKWHLGPICKRQGIKVQKDELDDSFGEHKITWNLKIDDDGSGTLKLTKKGDGCNESVNYTYDPNMKEWQG